MFAKQSLCQNILYKCHGSFICSFVWFVYDCIDLKVDPSNEGRRLPNYGDMKDDM